MVAAVLTISALALPARAQTVNAIASGTWLSDWDAPAAVPGALKPAAGIAGAGINIRRAGAVTGSTARTTGTYVAGGVVSAFGTTTGGGATASTSSWAVTTGPGAAAGTFNSSVKSFASIAIPLFASSGAASATADDPQEVATQGFFLQSLSLAAGSQLITGSGPISTSTGSLDYVYDTIDLGFSSPLATIDLTSTDGGAITPSVFFSNDARVAFFQHGTSTPITSADVETLLSSGSVQSELASNSGLSGDLALFDMQVDLTATPILSDSAFSNNSVGNVTAVTAPEPGTLPLVALVVGVPAFAMYRRRMKAITA